LSDLPQKCSQTYKCRTCTHLIDNRYCLRWRDIVPEEAQEDGCDEWTDELPF
jgi:hypothetical protein